MSQVSAFFKGIGIFFKSLEIIFSKGLWHFLFYPILLRILFIVLVSIGLISLSDLLSGYLNDFFLMKNIPDSGHYLSWLKSILTPTAGFLSWIITKIVSLMILWILSTVNKYIILVIISPILSLVSEATEEKLTEKKFPFSFQQLLKDIFRGIIISLRNMSIEYLLFFAGFFLLLIPVLGPVLFSIYQIFLLFVSWYFFGFAMMDYNCERHKFSIKRSVDFIWKNKGLISGIGFCYWLLISVPIFGNWIGFSFAPIMGAVGATVAFNELNKTVV